MKNLLLSTGFSPAQQAKFLIYYEMLIEKNKVMNLTAITEPREVLEKHFLDSVLPSRLIPHGASVIDVGTGAGFPGVPLLIIRDDIDVTLLDSLNKRLVFLNDVLLALNLTGRARTVHARAEDGARPPFALRGRFDVTTTRAVASADKLVEWTVPYLKVGGVSLMYKTAAPAACGGESRRVQGNPPYGETAHAPTACAAHALAELRAEAKVEKLDAAWGERSVVIVKKLAPTPEKYPRSAAEIKKKPLV